MQKGGKSRNVIGQVGGEGGVLYLELLKICWVGVETHYEEARSMLTQTSCFTGRR